MAGEVTCLRETRAQSDTVEGELTPCEVWETLRLLDMKWASEVNLPWSDLYGG